MRQTAGFRTTPPESMSGGKSPTARIMARMRLTRERCSPRRMEATGVPWAIREMTSDSAKTVQVLEINAVGQTVGSRWNRDFGRFQLLDQQRQPPVRLPEYLERACRWIRIRRANYLTSCGLSTPIQAETRTLADTFGLHQLAGQFVCVVFLSIGLHILVR